LTTLLFGRLIAGMNEFLRNANFAFVIAKKAKPDARETNWKQFLYNIQKPGALKKTTQMIGEGAWLIPLKNDIQSLKTLFDQSNSCNIPLRILFLNDEPDWIEYLPSDEAETS
jgi:hypothetical protein